MKHSRFMPTRKLVTAAVAAALIAGCASTPKQPAGSAEVRAKLTLLQSDTNLANRAPVALKDAETAVRAAESPEKDVQLAAHRLYLADRKVDTARALAETQAAEAERLTLNQSSEKARLDSRPREAVIITEPRSCAGVAGRSPRPALSRLARAETARDEQRLPP
jgi:type IV pilus biogenesis protein CpaD/CtpE